MIIQYNGRRKYNVVVGRNIISSLNDYYHFKNEKKLLFVDENIAEEDVKKITNNLNNYFVYRFKSGEESKKLEVVYDVLAYLINHKFSRSDFLISVGGGVSSDIGGFVASIYKRGMNFAIIATTTLAMVDASIGGKNGVDFNGIKNTFGTFYNPKLVICDLDLLKTLPKRHFYNGLVEALKMGLLVDEKLYNLFLKGDLEHDLEQIITLAVTDKINIVKKDEIDSSLRMILNFGHTIGHAIETINLGNVYHGEAVAYGMLYMIDDKRLRLEVKNILNKMNINTDRKENNELIKQYVLQDKKIRNGILNLICLHKLNDFYVCKIREEDFDVPNLQR